MGMLIYALVLLLAAVLPIPSFALFIIETAFFGPFVLAFIQAIIAFYSFQTAQRYPLFATIFVGSIISLPIALVGGFFVSLSNAFNDLSLDYTKLYLTREVIALIVLISGYGIGKILLRPNVFQDRLAYRRAVRIAFYLIFALFTAGWLLILLNSNS